MDSHGKVLPMTFKRYLASTYALQVNHTYAAANCVLAQLFKLIGQNADKFNTFPQSLLAAACEGVRNLTELHGRKACRAQMVQHGLTQHVDFLNGLLLPCYIWTMQCLWTAASHEAGVQSENRTLVNNLKGHFEEFLIIILPEKPFYSLLDDVDLDSWSRLLQALIRSRVPSCLARELESFRRHLKATENFPQPAINVDAATRSLLLMARVANLALRQPDTCGAITECHLLEHACALRLTLAERPWNWDASETDSCLFGLLKRASQRLPWRWLHGVPSCTSKSVLLRTPTIGERLPAEMPLAERRACEQLWPMLSHGAVQCYLGWWLAASVAVLRPSGSPALLVPQNLLVSCRACWQRRGAEDGELRGLQAPMHAAAVSWMYGMLTRQCRSTIDGMTAVAEKPASLVVPLRSPRGGRGGMAGGGGVQHSDYAAALSYTPQNIFDLLLPAAEHCVEYVTSVKSLGSLFADTLAISALPLSLSLQLLPTHAAAARLPSCWHLLGRILAMKLGSSKSRTIRDVSHAACRLLRLQLAVQESRSDWCASSGGSSHGSGSGRTSAGIGVGSSHDYGAYAAEAAVMLEEEVGDIKWASEAPDARSTATYPLGPRGPRGCATTCEGAAVSSHQPLRQRLSGNLNHHLNHHHYHHHEQQQQQQGPRRYQFQLPQIQSAAQQLPYQYSPRLTGLDERRCQTPSLTLRCALAANFLCHFEHTLRAVMAAAINSSTSSAASDANGFSGDGGAHQAHQANWLGAAYDITSACIAVDQALRRPGCWPALLAHGPHEHMASLILTLRKMTVAVDQMERMWPQTQSATALAAAGSEVPPVSELRTVWRLQLLALLEQCLPFTQPPRATVAAVRALAAASEAAAATATAAAAASSLPPQNGSRCSSPVPGSHLSSTQLSSQGAIKLPCAPAAPGPHLYVNLGLCGVTAAAGGSPGVDTFFGLQCRCNDNDDDFDVDSGPDWLSVLSTGACPPAGSAARTQQERLLVLAAAAWLPLLLTTAAREGSSATDGRDNSGGGRRAVPVPITVLAVHGGHRAAWEWLFLVAQQCQLSCGTISHDSWLGLLRRTLVVDHISAVLRLYCTWVARSQKMITTETIVAMSASGGAAGVGTAAATASVVVGSGSYQHSPRVISGCGTVDGGGREWSAALADYSVLHEAALRVSEVMSRVLDVWETMVAAVPELIARALYDNRKARELYTSVKGITSGGATDGGGEMPYPGDGSPAVLAQQRRWRLQRQRQEEQRQAALPPAWGPGLPLDPAVVSVLTLYGRQGLMHDLAELSTARGDRFSFKPRSKAAVPGEGLAKTAASSWQQSHGGIGVPVGAVLPDPDTAMRKQLGFGVCAHEGCTNLEGSSEATLLLRACGGGRGYPSVSYCCVACQQAERQANSAALEAHGPRRRRASARRAV